MGKGLLGALGLDSTERSTPVTPGAKAAQATADPVSQEHDRLARLIAGVPDAKKRKELEQRLANLRSVHAGGRALGDPGKRASLEKAELDAAAKLLARVRAIADSAVAAPPATGTDAAVADAAVAGSSSTGAPAPGSGAQIGAPAAAPPAPAVDAGASPSKGDLPRDLVAACDKHLRAHRFKATPSQEIVPGDMRCDVWLDDRLVKQDDVRTALLAALPALAPYPVPLARLVADRWALEVQQAQVFSGRMPRQTPTVVAKPDGVLARSVDGQEFWQPAPIATMAGSEPVVDSGWLKDFFDFYDIAPAPDGGKPGSCRFNDADDTLDGAVRKAGEQATLAGYKPDASAAAGIAKAILDKRDAARKKGAAVAEKARAAAAAAQPGKEPNQGLQVVPSLAAQYTGHWVLTPLPTKQADPKADVVFQFSLAVNDVRHPKDKKGDEMAGQIVVGYNPVTKKWQLLGGAQFVAVVAVWGRVQLQFFSNIQAGVARKLSEQQDLRGVLQVQTGAQLVVTLGPAQLGILAGAGGTVSESAPTLDVSPVTVGVSVPFDVAPGKKPEARKPEIDVSSIASLPMADLLDALEAIRDAKQLDQLDIVPERMLIAKLAVLGKLDDAMKSMEKTKLADADRDALRRYLYRGIGRS